MPETVLLLYRDREEVPALEYIERLNLRAQARALYLLERLQSEGHDLRRPHAAPLRDEIHEPRVDEGNVHHRLLYFFHGQQVVVLTHGLRKEREVPPREIDRALRLKAVYLADPTAHTLEIEL